MTAPVIASLDEAISYFRHTLDANPQRNIHDVENAVIDGRRRPYAGIGLIHPARPDDALEPAGELELPRVEMPPGAAADLAREIIGKLAPLKMLNPVSASFGLGCGTGTFITSFGIPINERCDNTPAYNRTLDEMLAEPAPDPASSGVMPRMRERIAFLKDCTPAWFKIDLPDLQGPYNIVHATIGEEALTAPYTEPRKFREFMARVTDFWLAATALLREWIGPERIRPWNRLIRICDCSVNLISPRMYVEHIMEHDLRICRAFAPIDMHTCSGQHVFDVTLANLPGLACTEAGYGEGLTAGYTAIEHAIKALQATNIALRIGQMLPRGQEYEFIRRDLDLYERFPRLMFHYTGMYWLKKDRPLIRDIHARLDEYWQNRYGSTAGDA
jgi:hypothetical protein